jgi:hypothetical protein
MPGIDAYTKLLLPCDGIDGFTGTLPNLGNAQSFLTQNGAKLVTAQTAQSKFGGRAVSFNGSSYLSIPDSDDWNFGTGDFTIECWVNFSSFSGTKNIISQSNAGITSFWQTYFSSAKRFGFQVYNSPTTLADYEYDFSATVILNTWYHFVIVRNGTSLLLFIDGDLKTWTIIYTAIGNSSIPDISGNIYIGNIVFVNYMNGWIDEVRISKGIARWTSNFSVPVIAYTTDSYTKLLLHFDEEGNYLDSSEVSTGKIVTPIGTAQLSTAQTKFGTASLLLDGNSDYLTVPDSDDWSFGTNPFTIDCWVYLTSNPINSPIYTQNNGSMPSIAFTLHTDISGLRFYAYNSGFIIDFWNQNTVSYNLNAWNHIALVRIDGGNTSASWRIFINGISIPLVLNAGAWNASIPNLSTQILVGRDIRNSTYFFGYMDEYRISSGIARWTTDFSGSLPSVAYITDSYTKLLLHFDGDNASTIITDISSVGYPITLNGSFILYNTAPKFGNACLYLDGSSAKLQSLSIPSSSGLDFGIEDFTIDTWIKIPIGGGGILLSNGWGPSIIQACGYYLGISETSMSFFYAIQGDYYWGYGATKSCSISSNTWTHIALVRSGGTIFYFVNGISIGTHSIGSDNIHAEPSLNAWIGAMMSTWQNFSGFYKGYIDEFRVSKGIARWTSTFEPSQTEYDVNNPNMMMLF